MKVEIVKRGWWRNQALVLGLVIRNLIPLLLITLGIELALLLSEDDSLTSLYPGSFQPFFMREILALAMGEGLSWAFVLVPLQQACCLLLVARCYRRRTPMVELSITSFFRSIPWLFLYGLIGTFNVGVSMIPGLIVAGLGMPAVPVGQMLLVLTLFFPLWMIAGLALGPAAVVTEGRGPREAYILSLDLARGRRLYLLGFLGLLFLLALAPDVVIFALMLEPATLPGVIPGPGADIVPGLSTLLVVILLLRCLCSLPLLVAPIVLYTQFRFREYGLGAAQLAQLVDEVGQRNHDGSP